jgi:3-dehydrotetronate 4-kinase
MILGAIADDFTGATDLCSVLTRQGLRVVQTIGVVPDVELPEVDAVVVALKSRTAPAEDAVADSRAALAWLRELDAERIFFKICSTFDSTPEGNIGPVADVLLDDLGGDVALVCPAYPANGRTVYLGHLFVGRRLLSESSMAHHPLTPMTDSDLVRVLGRQTSRRVELLELADVRAGRAAERVEELRGAGAAYVVADAVDDDDLRALAAAARDVPLLVGGAGLAIGLAAGSQAQPAVARGAGPAVVLAGSCSQATREQVRRMAGRYPSVRIDPVLHPPIDELAAETLSHLETGAVLVYSTAEPDEVQRAQEQLGAASASAAVESILGELARRAVDAGARRLVVAGGETSGAVVQALGIRALAVGEEIAPGVPWMTSLGEPPLSLALKSGNFGGPDFFLEAVA